MKLNRYHVVKLDTHTPGPALVFRGRRTARSLAPDAALPARWASNRTGGWPLPEEGNVVAATVRKQSEGQARQLGLGRSPQAGECIERKILKQVYISIQVKHAWTSSVRGRNISGRCRPPTENRTQRWVGVGVGKRPRRIVQSWQG